MHKYIIRRLMLLIPVLLGATFIVFFIMDLSPGDPALSILGSEATSEQLFELREEMGLNDPFLVRYGKFILNLCRGDLGISYKNNQPVMPQILERLPNTFLLGLASLLFALLFGVPVGIISARKQYTIFDNTTMIITLLGASTPSFWFGLVAIIMFSLNWRIFPAAGMGAGGKALFMSLVLPAVTLGTHSAATIARMTRSAMLDVIRSDYVDTARSKGISEPRVIFWHQLRNALIPIVTVIGLQMGTLFGGAVMTETVFAWPGIGRYIVDSIRNKDIPCVMGAVTMLAVSFTLINLLVDVIYAAVDPRIKAQYKSVPRRARKHA